MGRQSLAVILTRLGLSDKEALVYLSLLSLKQGTVQRIAVASGIKRVTAYVVLNSLMEKGLVSQVNKNKKIEFLAENPGNLLNLLDNQIQKIEQRKNELRGALPLLTRYHEFPEHMPEVRFLVGKETLSSIFEEQLKQLKAIKNSVAYGITSYTKRAKIFKPEDFAEFFKRRQKIQVRGKQLFEGTLDRSATNPYGEYRQVDFPIEADFTLYLDTTVIVTYSDPPVGVIIADKAITQTLRGLFEHSFRHHDVKSKRLDKKNDEV